MDKETSDRLNESWEKIGEEVRDEGKTVIEEYKPIGKHKKIPIVCHNTPELKAGNFLFRTRIIRYKDTVTNNVSGPIFEVREWSTKDGTRYFYGEKGLALSLDKINELRRLFDVVEPLMKKIIEEG